MDDLMKIRKLYALKRVMRATSVADRHESSAEHSWSCLVLADYLMNRMENKLDRVKVYELLMYHDVVEVETGDTPLEKKEERKAKQAIERKAMNKMSRELPENLSQKALSLFLEFEDKKTEEARFAKAVDRLDAFIQQMDHKDERKYWNETKVRELYEQSFEGFPVIQKLFEELLKFVKKDGHC
jgi:putative hydrolases of HD superfamily